MRLVHHFLRKEQIVDLGNFVKSRTGGVVLGATALVTLGGIGGATAAGMITSDDIKDQTIQRRDIGRDGVASSEVLNHSLGMRDLNDHTRAKINAPGPRGPAGADGADGTNGKDGAAGPAGSPGAAGKDGVNAYDTVPPGKTVYGAIGGDFHSNNDSGTADWGVDASLPMRAQNPLTDSDVVVNVSGWQSSDGQLQPTSADSGEATCDGTWNEPTAPEGTVCIYVTGADNAVNLEGYSVAFGSEGSPYGFKLKWDIAGQGDTFVDAVWAYTAPNPQV
jgi:hypothetical protein